MDGLYKHYSLIAKASHYQLFYIMFHLEQVVICFLKLLLRLANEFKNIIGIKEASGDLNQVKQLIIDKPDDF